jgi:hypothetical protein
MKKQLRPWDMQRKARGDFKRKETWEVGEEERNKYTKPMARYISLVNEYCIGPEQCSLAWVFKEKICYH